jgi:hypothetical protein
MTQSLVFDGLKKQNPDLRPALQFLRARAGVALIATRIPNECSAYEASTIVVAADLRVAWKHSASATSCTRAQCPSYQAALRLNA